MGPREGFKNDKAQCSNTGLSQLKGNGMWTHIFSLLDSLTQTAFVWNGDIIVNVSGGAVDWIGLVAVMVIVQIVRK